MDAGIAREAQRGQVAAVLRAALFYGDFGAALLNAGYVLDALVNHRTDGLEEFKTGIRQMLPHRWRDAEAFVNPVQRRHRQRSSATRWVEFC